METPSTPFTSGYFFAWIEHLVVNFISNVAGGFYILSWNLAVKRHEFGLRRDSRILTISQPPSAILPTLCDARAGSGAKGRKLLHNGEGAVRGGFLLVMSAKCSFSTNRAYLMQYFAIKFTYKFSVNKIMFYI